MFAAPNYKNMKHFDRIIAQIDGINAEIEDLQHAKDYCDKCSDGVILIRDWSNDPCLDKYEPCNKCSERDSEINNLRNKYIEIMSYLSNIEIVFVGKYYEAMKIIDTVKKGEIERDEAENTLILLEEYTDLTEKILKK